MRQTAVATGDTPLLPLTESFTAELSHAKSLAGFRHSCRFDEETEVFRISPASQISGICGVPGSPGIKNPLCVLIKWLCRVSVGQKNPR